MKTSKKKICKHDIIFNWIKNFQKKNEYNPISLKPYNKKFKIEFNYFVNNNKFSKEIIKTYLIS